MPSTDAVARSHDQVERTGLSGYACRSQRKDTLGVALTTCDITRVLNDRLGLRASIAGRVRHAQTLLVHLTGGAIPEEWECTQTDLCAREPTS